MMENQLKVSANLIFGLDTLFNKGSGSSISHKSFVFGL